MKKDRELKEVTKLNDKDIIDSLEHFEIIPSISIYRGKIIQTQGDMIKPFIFRNIEPNPMDIIDVLHETFENILIVDYDGRYNNNPDIEFYKKISQLGDFWVDCGLKSSNGIIDILNAGTQYAVLWTSTLNDLNELREAFEISEKIIFGIEHNNDITSPDNTLKSQKIVEVIQEVQEMGLERCLLSEIGRIEQQNELKRKIIISLMKTGLKIYLRSDIKFDDLITFNNLKAAGTTIGLSEILNNPQAFSIDLDLLSEVAPELTQESKKNNSM